MMLWIFGQPGSGKTTLAQRLAELFLLTEDAQEVFWLDGDEFRKMFKNTDYSRAGRIENIRRAAVIAQYEAQRCPEKKRIVICSFVTPYKEMREYIESITDGAIKFVFLYYDTKKDKRGRENFHVNEFDTVPYSTKNTLMINTTVYDRAECVKEIYNFYFPSIPSQG